MEHLSSDNLAGKKYRGRHVVLRLLCFLAPLISFGVGALSVVPAPANYLLLWIIPLGCILAVYIYRKEREANSKLAQAAQCYLIGSCVPFVIFVLPWILLFLLSFFIK